MKKLLLLLLMMIGAATVHAEDYAYLTFETTDGAKASVSVSGLTISVSGSTLTAGTETFTLSNLSKMYFSNTNETTGIESITITTLEDNVEIYDLNGKKVSKDLLKKGVYILKSKTGTSKIAVK